MVATVGLVVLALRRGSNGVAQPVSGALEERLVGRVSTIVSEAQSDLMGRFDTLDQRMATFEQQIREDLDNLHRRVEHLEARDRERAE